VTNPPRRDEAHTDWVTAAMRTAHRSAVSPPPSHRPTRHFVQDICPLIRRYVCSLQLLGRTAFGIFGGTTARRFVGHTKDVLSWHSLLITNQIVSASRDKSIKLWNTLGECKYTIRDRDSHSVGFMCTFQPKHAPANFLLQFHKDHLAKMRNLSKRQVALDSHWTLWLCIGYAQPLESGIKIWDLESKSIVVDLRVDLKQESDLSSAEGGGAAYAKICDHSCTRFEGGVRGSTLSVDIQMV
ncbi:Guanine nucleotide-binding protein subunit beta-2-like 1, partial [Datura stramonium]|nr:Guanine nucleotide-binding protein subunit beta-2-like 1 [Datura stramonium]